MTAYDSGPHAGTRAAIASQRAGRRASSHRSLLVVVAAAIVLVVSGSLNSDDGESTSRRESHASANGGGCQPAADIRRRQGRLLRGQGGRQLHDDRGSKTCVSRTGSSELNPNLDPFGLQPQNCVDLVDGRVQGARRRLTPPPARPRVAPVLLALLAAPRGAAAAPDAARGLPARAWVLVDAADGEVLAAHRAPSSYSIASTTKLMTAYVARRDLGLAAEVVAPPVRRAAGRVAAGPGGGGADRGPRPALRPAAGLGQRRRGGARPGRRRVRGRRSSPR